MTITRWIPRSSLLGFQNEVDRLMDSVFGTEPETADECLICPSVDIEEYDKYFLLHFELPGINKKDVTINVKDNILTVEGEKKAGKKSDSDKYHLSERVYGKFRRNFRLPETVDTENIEAEYVDGVLNLTVPKLAEALPKQIEIKVK
ncbi:MAG TPA: Hsp20/alpha crystallin family protein [Candidatus Marinimicrobia bacterium]|nr:Hsp20/alpha crystallin family protein [Candidatus Neomarinimicrobiota bacterium]